MWFLIIAIAPTLCFSSPFLLNVVIFLSLSVKLHCNLEIPSFILLQSNFYCWWLYLLLLHAHLWPLWMAQHNEYMDICHCSHPRLGHCRPTTLIAPCEQWPRERRTRPLQPFGSSSLRMCSVSLPPPQLQLHWKDTYAFVQILMMPTLFNFCLNYYKAIGLRLRFWFFINRKAWASKCCNVHSTVQSDVRKWNGTDSPWLTEWLSHLTLQLSFYASHALFHWKNSSPILLLKFFYELFPLIFFFFFLKSILREHNISEVYYIWWVVEH